MSKPGPVELRELAESVMDVVLIAAGRRLQQVLEQVHEEEIAPLRARIMELEQQLAAAQRSPIAQVVQPKLNT